MSVQILPPLLERPRKWGLFCSQQEDERQTFAKLLRAERSSARLTPRSLPETRWGAQTAQPRARLNRRRMGPVRLGPQAVAVWVMLFTHWVAVVGMRVPLQAPAAVHVAVVFPQP